MKRKKIFSILIVITLLLAGCTQRNVQQQDNAATPESTVPSTDMANPTASSTDTAHSAVSSTDAAHSTASSTDAAHSAASSQNTAVQGSTDAGIISSENITSGKDGDITSGKATDKISAKDTNISSAGEKNMISAEEAKACALNHAGLTEDRVTFIKSELDRDYDEVNYDVEFYTDERLEYDYEIDAYTGKILGYDVDSHSDIG